MSDSGRTIGASQIEAHEAFRIEEAVNLDDLAARNRKLHHHEEPPVGHDDNPRGAIDERRNQVAAFGGGGDATRARSRMSKRVCSSCGNPPRKILVSVDKVTIKRTESPSHAFASNSRLASRATFKLTLTHQL
jgi:hypothetical protein